MQWEDIIQIVALNRQTQACTLRQSIFRPLFYKLSPYPSKYTSEQKTEVNSNLDAGNRVYVGF